MPNRVESLDRRLYRRGVQILVGFFRIQRLTGPGRRSPAEDDQVDQGVGSQPVRAVHGGASRFAHGHQSAMHGVGVVRLGIQRLAPEIGWYSAHIVMHGRQDGYRIPGHIDARENLRRF